MTIFFFQGNLNNVTRWIHKQLILANIQKISSNPDPRLALIYIECKHAFHFCISQAVLYIIFPMSLNYQNTRTHSGIFRTSCSLRSILVLHYTSQTHVFRNPRQYLVVQNQCNAKQAIGTTGVFIATLAQLSRNGTMKHEAMPDHASFDIKLPKSIYSDDVISVFSYIIRFSLLSLIANIIWLMLHMSKLLTE